MCSAFGHMCFAFGYMCPAFAGELVYIHVRSLKQGAKFRGIMLYAKDSSGNKVGAWEVLTEAFICATTLIDVACNQEHCMSACLH